MALIVVSVLQIQEDCISLSSFDAMESCISSWQVSDDEVDNRVRGSLPQKECILARTLFKYFIAMLKLQLMFDRSGMHQ